MKNSNFLNIAHSSLQKTVIINPGIKGITFLIACFVFVCCTFSDSAQSLSGDVELYDWVDFPIEAPEAASGINKWDVEGSCVWTHEDGITQRTSLLWYSGSGDTYIYRFGGSFQGKWTCTSSSPVDALDSLEFEVEVLPSSNPDRTGWSGRIQDNKTAWARQQGPDGQLAHRTPILIMMPQVQNWYDNLDSMK
jgi:hypothetical protein